jgi:site-specific DNA-cytosine methylase
MKPSKFNWDQEPDKPAEHIFFGRVVRDPASPRQSAPRGPRASSSALGLEGLRPTRFGEPADFGEGRDAPAVLVINSYAGSLVQAAKDCGLRVAGSFEDAAYGLGVQRINFPELDGLWAGSRRHWPNDLRLDDKVVIAHPPCAAFSKQQTGNVKKQRAAGEAEITGVSAAKFQCTVDVLDYSLIKRPMALAVESVPDAFTKGAREVHEAKAAEHGYKLFHVHQNAVTFGVPQWRPRYWAVYMRSDVVRDRMAFRAPSFFSTFGEIMDGGEPFADHLKKTAKQRALIESAGIDPARVFDADEDGRVHHILKRIGDQEHPEWTADDAGPEQREARAAWFRRCRYELAVNGKFEAQAMMMLARNAVAPTLVHNSWWHCGGRLASKGDYNVAMGFPRDYAFPAGTNPTEVRGLLSRGVCPPVASWLLETIVATIARREPPVAGVSWCEPGESVDLRPDVKTRKGLLAVVEEAAR